jgi:hypothetical protein
MTLGSNSGQHAHIALEIQASSSLEFKAQGRWCSKRTGDLRCWSLPPFVQVRSRKYTSTLKAAYFDAPKYQEVSQRSPALGSKLGSNVGNHALLCHMDSYQSARKHPRGACADKQRDHTER